MWQWTCQVTVCHLTGLLESSIHFLSMQQTYVELLKVSGTCSDRSSRAALPISWLKQRCGQLDLIRWVFCVIPPAGLSWTKFSIIGHSMGESQAWTLTLRCVFCIYSSGKSEFKRTFIGRQWLSKLRPNWLNVLLCCVWSHQSKRCCDN